MNTFAPPGPATSAGTGSGPPAAGGRSQLDSPVSLFESGGRVFLRRHWKAVKRTKAEGGDESVTSRWRRLFSLPVVEVGHWGHCHRW